MTHMFQRNPPTASEFTPAASIAVESTGSESTADNFTLRISSGQSLTPELIDAVDALCDRVEDAEGAPAVMISLHGGTDSAQWPGDVGIHLVSRWEKALRRLERLDSPTIAAATGECSGPALEVLLTADLRIGSDDLVLDTSSGLDSVWAGMFIHRLANQLGAARARQLILFGARIDAMQARDIGLIDDIDEDPPAAVARRVSRSGQSMRAALAIRRRLLLDAGATSFEDALGKHLAACDRALRRKSDDSSRAPGSASGPVSGPIGSATNGEGDRAWRSA